MGLDRAREKTKVSILKKSVVPVLILLVLLFGLVNIFTIDFSTQRVSKDTLLIGSVELGHLEIRSAANGVLLPRQIELLSAQTDGRVLKVHVSPGDEVEVGQLLVVLSNPVRSNAVEEAESAWLGALANLDAYEIELQNNLLNLEADVLRANNASEQARLQLEAESVLHDRGIIADVEFQRTQLNVELLQKEAAIEMRIFEQSNSNLDALLTVRRSEVTQLAQAKDREVARLNNLRIVAGINGIVQDIEVGVGQQLSVGATIGELASLELLYAELQVPARQAGDVFVGQAAVVDTRNGLIEGIVERVDPRVSDGFVNVDVTLSGELPRGARPQLQIEGQIYKTQLLDVLHAPRPALVRPNAEMDIFTVDQNEEYAIKIRVKFGRASVNRIEILEGLNEGDKIILSDVSGWLDQDKILID